MTFFNIALSPFPFGLTNKIKYSNTMDGEQKNAKNYQFILNKKSGHEETINAVNVMKHLLLFFINLILDLFAIIK